MTARTLLADRTVVAVTAAAVVVVAAASVGSFGPVGTPFGTQLLPWPLLPCIAPLLLSGGVTGAVPRVERASRRGAAQPTILRSVACAVAIAVAAAVVASNAPPGDITASGSAAWRNAALVSGLALLGAAVLPSSAAWVPSSAYVLVCAVVGVQPGESPPAWSLLAQPSGTGTVPALAILVLGASVSAAVLARGRPRSRRGGSRRAVDAVRTSP